MRTTATMSPLPVPPLDHIQDANVHGNRNYWTNYEWPERGDEWSALFGGTETMWYCTLLPRIRQMVPTGHILEIAPGMGRCTQYLRHLCRKLTIVDLVPRCIDACRERFAGDPRIEYHVNDGRSLAMVPDNSVDFVFSWDSLVHAEHETVRAYLEQLRQKLKPGGMGFIHHSNLGMQAHQLRPDHPADEFAGRRPSMSAELFRQDCRQIGLRCLAQELVPWTRTKLVIDAISLFVRDEANAHVEPIVQPRWDWATTEYDNGQRIAKMYRRPSDAGAA